MSQKLQANNPKLKEVKIRTLTAINEGDSRCNCSTQQQWEKIKSNNQGLFGPFWRFMTLTQRKLQGLGLAILTIFR